jgi:hypothetical protein
MKRIAGILALLALSLSATAQAYTYTPFDIVNAAYQDRLPGIPSGGVFCAEVNQHTLGGDELVNAAIDAGYVSVEAGSEEYEDLSRNVARMARAICID